MDQIINLTPHTVTVIGEDGKTVVFPSEGNARASQVLNPACTICNVDVVSIAYGETDGLPEPEPGIYYIVSTITANAAKTEGRYTGDLLVTVNPVRDEKGAIIGCRYLGFA